MILEQLREKQDTWESLQNAEKPLLLYGMGDGALKIMAVMKRYGIRLSGIFASDGFVRGHSFAGFPVLSYSQAVEQFGDFIVVLAFGAFRQPLLSYLYDLSRKHEFYAPDVPVCTDGVPFEEIEVITHDYLRAHEGELDQVYSMLSDSWSKKVFLDVLDFKVSGKVSYLERCTTPVEEAYQNLICPGAQEDYVDLGAYTGDTLEEFLSYTGGRFRSLTAFEPDPKNFKRMQKRMEKLGISDLRAVCAASAARPGQVRFSSRGGRNSAVDGSDGVMIPAESVDHVLAGRPATILKLDVEGAEEEALLGSRETLRRYHPKLILSAYHRNSDLYRLPLLACRLGGEYQVYLRHHPYIPAWETNFYLTT